MPSGLILEDICQNLSHQAAASMGCALLTVITAFGTAALRLTE
jgi:hypothetical protein